MHSNETMMRRNMFDIQAQNNSGKQLNFVYDKRAIVSTQATHVEEIKYIDTLPFGYIDLCMLEIDTC